MNVNPILPGFHPDPTICRVGDDHYLATSSFEYFPGVPIFHSTNLTDWEQIGNVLTRPTQLNVTTGLAGASAGIYAPTLRHHDGRFWLITTNRADIRKGHLLVHTDDPAGAWSEPTYVDGAIGIDPDLAWDVDGTCHVSWTMPGAGILQAALDPGSGKLLTEQRTLWRGTGLAHPEGPHLVHHDDWWYLVIAEGGTERGHAVSVARSRTITGPFVANSANPILTRAGTDHPVQNTGHADLVELADGTWAMVHLGVRPRGTTPQFHVNGRETFLAGVDWVDGWPTVVEDRFAPEAAATSFVDDFSASSLHPRWISPGTDPATFVRRRAQGGITLAAGRAADAREARHLLAVRARDLEWQATAAVPDGDASLTVRIDDAHWAAVQRQGRTLTARMVIGPLDQTLATENEIEPRHPLAIRAVAKPDAFSLRQGPDLLELGHVRDGDFQVLATVDGRYLSTEVAGGFTGRVIGVEALGAGATLTRFVYQPAVSS
ncbi:family 43 glycosylhydrolase [Frankia sp. CNm7]|uniref:Family 43 glycosylhydrolase n=1 Tax=Frankia nepalensis TaxID=1836974 RepID=A0A937US74_9ACTN|nr:glycoside hydrolase family 43 protein [Frankia nepalensis]MBL7498235.1 family 43 glycosylhydrolase [Frankia nepalensis]MBL7509531.1 family 43 glycosylhydrolase [Frankia nepalensis]MBL7517281.1 family 43 glycosylhydrolase [Frankia nepalensis]MBL7632162.1 family 43 glycosylhydrolase [Frankia nepalensis]